MNKKGLGFISITIIIIGILGIYFIFKMGILSEFLNYIKNLFFNPK